MKHPKLAVGLLIATGLLAGCTSVTERRIAAHEETWEKLSPQDQVRLQHGGVRAGDTEEMVLIALGPPDEELSIANPGGPKQTEWLYELPEQEPSSPFEPGAGHSKMPIRARRYIFEDGVIVGRHPGEGVGAPDVRPQAKAEFMLDQLNRLVSLTSEQREAARKILVRANEALLAINPAERAEGGTSIRIQMRADIRVLLNPRQQATYDATPQYLGGGAFRKR